MRTSLPRHVLDAVERRLADHDALLERAYPGDDGSRQPSHTVYVPADRYRPGLARDWGAQAQRLLAESGGIDALLEALEIRPEVRDAVAVLVSDKLASEPVEDLRIDLEDGYGNHPDGAEDAVVVAAARGVRAEVSAGTATPFVGIRFKSFERPTRARGIRSLDLFVSTLLEGGPVPEGLVLTLPKVTAVEQVETMTMLCTELERAHGLTAGRLRFEIQVETPQAVLDHRGTGSVALMVHAGEGRVCALHYGTYDYSASLGIAAPYQSLSHPAADHAKAVMQLAAAGTGVRLSDGSTNIVPAGDRDQVWAAWRNHGQLVRRSLERGYYQGWDMDPGHLPSRFAATYAFYREDLDPAAARLRDYVRRATTAVMDEPATATALAGFLKRGLDCGAVSAQELAERTDLSVAEVAAFVTPRRTSPPTPAAGG